MRALCAVPRDAGHVTPVMERLEMWTLPRRCVGLLFPTLACGGLVAVDRPDGGGVPKSVE
ncbi:MAG: hypothetical protein D8H96_10745 [Lautropia sp.]|nr:MAG: hypothetical protein D8H96_10745 [Lautropia sp.]